LPSRPTNSRTISAPPTDGLALLTGVGQPRAIRGEVREKFVHIVVGDLPAVRAVEIHHGDLIDGAAAGRYRRLQDDFRVEDVRGIGTADLTRGRACRQRHERAT
jgi:hypothetical protein